MSGHCMKSASVFSLLLLFSARAPAGPGDSYRDIAIPLGGNSWVVDGHRGTEAVISDSGITNWMDPGIVIRTFFNVERAGKISIGIRARVKTGQSRLMITFGRMRTHIVLSNADFKTVRVGNATISKAGYQWIDIRGIGKTAATFGEVTDLVIAGPATAGKVRFVKDEFYWGRRGPSVHLNYRVPAGAEDVRWFYNEITVPRGEDVMGSFFMANGFAEGYFGMQVNSPTERRILFSVWSPSPADDPGKVPDDQRVKLLKKGEAVHAGDFGDEGTGGQSYRLYDWRAGVTYRLLLKGEPSEGNSTDYTAYFSSPGSDTWELIASFRRPKTTTDLKRLHSFLENFLPETGQTSRKVLFSHPWVRSVAGRWYELTEATLTADATAKKEARRDFLGGVEGDSFFLKNCGFFNETSTTGTLFSRKPTGKAPEVDVEALR